MASLKKAMCFFEGAPLFFFQVALSCRKGDFGGREKILAEEAGVQLMQLIDESTLDVRKDGEDRPTEKPPFNFPVLQFFEVRNLESSLVANLSGVSGRHVL